MDSINDSEKLFDLAVLLKKPHQSNTYFMQSAVLD